MKILCVATAVAMLASGCWRTEKAKEHRPPRGAEPTDYVPEERDPR